MIPGRESAVIGRSFPNPVFTRRPCREVAFGPAFHSEFSGIRRVGDRHRPFRRNRVVAPKRAESIFSGIQATILSGFGWLYLLAVAIFLFSMIFMAFSRYNELKLGPEDSEPEFRYLSWIAMLFAAGMGIGLMYFAVGEPMTHFASPPEAEPLTIAAQREAMSVTFFHWGVHAWAIYSVVGLSLAYFGYRYNLPLTVRSGL